MPAFFQLRSTFAVQQHGRTDLQRMLGGFTHLPRALPARVVVGSDARNNVHKKMILYLTNESRGTLTSLSLFITVKDLTKRNLGGRNT